MENKNFTIADLERFSGVKAHTLRIWEKRYGLLKPNRSPGNFRLYTLAELKKILNIALLKKNGFQISGLSKFSDTEIENKIAILLHDESKWQKAINDLTINMYTRDPESFEWVLDELLLTWSVDILVEKIIFPFLKITHLLWEGNQLFEEHLVVTAARKKLIFAIECTVAVAVKDKTVLLFLPGTKQLDLGLLYCNYYLKRRSVHVLYLGNDVNIENLKIILQVHPPAYIFTYLQEHHRFPVSQLSAFLNVHIPSAKLIIAQYSASVSNTACDNNLLQLEYDNALFYLYQNGK